MLNPSTELYPRPLRLEFYPERSDGEENWLDRVEGFVTVTSHRPVVAVPVTDSVAVIRVEETIRTLPETTVRPLPPLTGGFVGLGLTLGWWLQGGLRWETTTIYSTLGMLPCKDSCNTWSHQVG